MILVPSALDLIPSQFFEVPAIELKFAPLSVDFLTKPVKFDVVLPSPAKYTVVPFGLPVIPFGSPKVTL